MDLESAHQAQIAAIDQAHKKEIAAKERAHEKAIAAKDRNHRKEIDGLNSQHKSSIDRFAGYADKYRKKAAEEASKRKEVKRRWNELAQTSPQTLTTSAAAESSIREAKEALPVEPATTPGPDLAEISPRDVAPSTSQLASTESPITKAVGRLPVVTEDLTEVESASPSKIGAVQQQEQQQEQQEEEQGEEEEEEPHTTEMLSHESSSMGQGAKQSHQEKDLAQDAPVPANEQAASSQLTEPEAAPSTTTSDDGASEAPVTMEVLREVQTGDRETEEPMAVAESVEEVHGTTSNDDGASMIPVTKENGNELEMPTAEESDQPPPVSNDHDESADEMGQGGDLATTDHPDDCSKAKSVQDWMSSPRESNAIADDLDDEVEDEPSDETRDSRGLDLSDSGTEQSDTADETDMNLDGESQADQDLAAALAKFEIGNDDSRMEDVGSDDNAVNDVQGSSSSQAGEKWLGSHMVQDSGNSTASGIGSQPNNDTPMETAPSGSQSVGNGQAHSSHTDSTTTTEMPQSSHQAYGNNQGLPPQINGMPSMETTQPVRQAYGNNQGLQSQTNNVPTTEMAKTVPQANGNNQGLQSQPNSVPATETVQSTLQWYSNNPAPPLQQIRPPGQNVRTILPLPLPRKTGSWKGHRRSTQRWCERTNWPEVGCLALMRLVQTPPTSPR